MFLVFLLDVWWRCGVAASPQLSLYIVLDALLSLPRADLSLQINLGFLHGCLLFLGAGEGGAGPGCLHCPVCTCNQVCSRQVLLIVDIVQGN